MGTREVTQKCPSTISAPATEPATNIGAKVQTGDRVGTRGFSGIDGHMDPAGPQKQHGLGELRARIGRCGHRGVWPPGEERKAPELI